MHNDNDFSFKVMMLWTTVKAARLGPGYATVNFRIYSNSVMRMLEWRLNGTVSQFKSFSSSYFLSNTNISIVWTFLRPEWWGEGNKRAVEWCDQWYIRWWEGQGSKQEGEMAWYFAYYNLLSDYIYQLKALLHFSLYGDRENTYSTSYITILCSQKVLSTSHWYPRP